MQNKIFVKLFEDLFTEIIGKIDFKDGKAEKLLKEETGLYEETVLNGVITISWKGNVKLVLNVRQKCMSYYYVTRNDEQVSVSYCTSKFDELFFRNFQKLSNQVDNGDFDLKKNVSDKIAEVVCKRKLTSYMNDTKWKEFLHAMTEEMPLAVPYDYKTLFEEEPEELRLGTAYDEESFNWYHFKSLEWVKVKPKFDKSVHKGKLVDDEIINYDVEAEFVTLMNKYSIPYEYDTKNEVYIIYGYK